MDDLDAQLSRWQGWAEVLIRRRLADARAHAGYGNFAAADERLRELRAPLVMLLADARAAYYREAVRVHHGLDSHPDEEAVARRVPVLGHKPEDAHTWITHREWEIFHAEAVQRRAWTALSDTQMALYHAVQSLEF
jgi:hypothetical protein